MRTETTKRDLYLFSELTGAAQARAIDNLREINVRDEYWYESTIEKANALGFKITFDKEEFNWIDAELDESPTTICQRILTNHGLTSGTYALALDYYHGTDLSGWNFTDEDREGEFARALEDEYVEILWGEYGRLTADKAVRKTIEANKYKFTKEGELA